MRKARLAAFLLPAMAALVLPHPAANADEGMHERDGGHAVRIAPSLTGVWRTGRGRSLVEIFRCTADGSAQAEGSFLCGRIVHAKRPEVEGHLLLAGFRPKGGAWRKGKIIDPRSRSTYRGRLTLLAPGQLEIRGCMLMFCRAQVWERVPDDFEDLPERGPAGAGNLPQPAGP